MAIRGLVRTGLIGVVLGAAAFAATAVQAQSPETPPPAAPPAAKQLPGPPEKIPEATNRDRSRGIEFLLGALKAAPNKDAARFVEGRIWSLWTRNPSDTAMLLMTRVKTASDAKNMDLAVQLLDSIIKLKPDYIEAWNRRATIYYLQKDFGHALADIREVLAREPRHFGALSGLGLILQELGDEKHALEAYRRALAIDPHLENVEEAIKNLREKVEGREI